MARQQRFRLPGYPQHIVQRGNDRQPCFFSESDYRFFLSCLRTGSRSHRCDVHAYVLMTNHVHLLVTPKIADGISKLMQTIGRRYVKMINSRYQRTGTLWEGRYKATVVDTDEYLLACYRYIELNPVRAGLVSDPSLYTWSSFRDHVGRRTSQLIRDHEVFLSLGKDEKSRESAYMRLFEMNLDQDTVSKIREATNKSRPLGNQRFETGILTKLGRGARREMWGGSRPGAGRPKGRL